TAAGSEVAAVLGKDAPNLRSGAVLVVGGGFDDDGHAARGIAFIYNLIKLLPVFAFAGTAFDCALYVIIRHALRAGRLDRAPQTGIAVGIATTGFSGDGDFL